MKLVSFDRRTILLGGAISALSLVNSSFAQNNDDITAVSIIPPLPEDLAAKSGDAPAPYIEVQPTGTGRPSDIEIKTAELILKNAPFDCKPIEVAEYFLAVGAGAYGAPLRSYAREWPVRANPVIFHFFSSTLTKPDGDVTPWCAAFLNWCILRSKAKERDEIGQAPGSFSISGKRFPTDNIRQFTTNSASSGSFRCWADISTPRRGDIVVFRDAGTDAMTAQCLGTGHVAFYLSVPRPGYVRVLGGNQLSPGSGGAVTVADMPTGSGSRFMKFVAKR